MQADDVEFQHKRQVREYFNLDYDPSETEILEQSYDKEDLTKIPHYDSLKRDEALSAP